MKKGQREQSKWAFDICCIAANYGRLDILKWAHKNGYVLNNNICVLAASNNHLHVLKWVRKKGFSFNHEVYEITAEQGYWKILNWAMYGDKKSKRWISKICQSAAEGGHLEILKQLLVCTTNNSEEELKLCVTVICWRAAKNGHYNILEYVINNYKKYIRFGDVRICRNAAENGHPHILNWYYQAGYKLDIDTCHYIVLYSHLLNIIEWTVKNK